MGGTISLETAIERWHSQEDYSVLLLGTSLQIKRSYYGNVQVASRTPRDNQARRVESVGNVDAILLDLENIEKNIRFSSTDDSEESMFRSRCNIFKV